VVVVGWSKGVQDISLEVMHAKRLADPTEPDGWSYLVVRGVWHDEAMLDFDARYELTAYPAGLLWGPGSREEALAWLEATAPVGDDVAHLDRLFAIRWDGGKVYFPCRPDVLLGLRKTAELGPGTWSAPTSLMTASRTSGTSRQASRVALRVRHPFAVPSKT